MRSVRAAMTKGKTYGYLKYIGPTKKSIRHGNHVAAGGKFLCTRCGKMTVKLLSRVLAGYITSCGCRKAAGNPSNFPTSDELKRRYKLKHEQKDATGEKWLVLDAAANYVGVKSKTTILGWAADGSVDQQPFLDGFGREVPYYKKKDLKKKRDERSARSRTPVVSGFMYFGDIQAETKIPARTLRRKLKDMGAKRKKVVAIGKDGKPRILSYYPHWAGEKLGVKIESNGQSHESNGEEKPKRGVGRPEGSVDQGRQKRIEQMLNDWDAGKFGTNKTAAGQAHDIDRSSATKIINAHDAEKCGNNSPP
jgi:hypothetical protein